LKRLLAAAMLSTMVLGVAPAAQAANIIKVCAYVSIEINDQQVVDEEQCNEVVYGSTSLLPRGTA
jgi:hypothetical protein